MKRLLYFSRIHEKKGVDFLLHAWRAVQEQHADWELWIAGPDNGGYLQKMKRLASELGLERATFLGPVYDEQKKVLFAESDLYVLPTRSENFGMTVAEAIAHGLPAIVTKGAPWRGLEENNCGWWIDVGQQPLVDCLRNTLSASRQELRERGARGRAWMERDFSWQRIGQMMHETYGWLLGGGPPPAWVHQGT